MDTLTKRSRKNSKVRSIILISLLILMVINTKGQPYFSLDVENAHAKKNVFKQTSCDSTTPPLFEQVKDKLPQPFWSSRQEVINCYWRAWEIAFSNLKKAGQGNGFISPYIDPAFNKHIFMWDCSFMCMYGKYASKVFNFQGTLDNFYVKQHPDGFICREIREEDGSDCFERFDPSSTGPNIMPWSEWEYFLNFNDTTRLSKVFPVLLAYYEWFETYRSWPDGSYYSSGWGCGMDNQPRMPKEFNPEWSHAHMSWIDITLQEVFAGSILIEMARRLNRLNEVKTIESEITDLKKFVNQKMWSEKENYYFDRFRDGSLSQVKSIASYWALLADVIPENRMQKFIGHLEDSSEFARVHRVPSLSADNPDFNPDGGYWRGAVWAPTNYMVLRGLTNNGFDSLAYQIALNHLNNVVEVFNSTNDIRENYAPDKVQGNNGHNFVGWTGLVPISVLFEYIFGIRPDVPNNRLILDVRLTYEYGVKQYPFGTSGMLSVSVKKRVKVTDKPEVTIESNQPITIILKWDGGSLEKMIQCGKNRI